MTTRIWVGAEQLALAELHDWLAASPQDGAIVTFNGKVRSLENTTLNLYLEHYPAMTEKVLHKIVAEARERWPIHKVAVLHRVGEIQKNEMIVFVGVSSAHRKAAFAAAEFIMDVLKTQAPFWKRETSNDGEQWVEAKQSDRQHLKKWY